MFLVFPCVIEFALERSFGRIEGVKGVLLMGIS
jgi:hypothetical protein